MGVKQLQYAQELEARLKKGKSLDTAHKSAGKAASVKKEKPKLNWAQKLKVKVGMTLAKEKRRRARMKVRRDADDRLMVSKGKGTMAQEEKAMREAKKKRVTRTSQVKDQLKNALSDREIKGM